LITVLGTEGTSEYEAGCVLRDRLLRFVPDVVDNDAHQVQIIAGAQCHGQRVRDIDLVVIASFGNGVAFEPAFPINDGYGNPLNVKSINVERLCLAVEVKDHTQNDVRFIGPRVEVRYQGDWHDATSQNQQQLYSLKAYLEWHHLNAPFIIPLVWLRNVSSLDLPPRPHNVIGAETVWSTLLSVVAQLSPPHWDSGVWKIDAFGRNASPPSMAAQIFTANLVPTHLDRKRMERLNERDSRSLHLETIVGSQFAILRGRGGTGKTIQLLQLAKRLYDTDGARILLLTYNHALVADIRRLLSLLGVSDGIGEGSIQVQTVHSYFGQAMHVLGLTQEIDTDPHFDDRRYQELKREAITYFESGAITESDHLVLQGTVQVFSFDYILVDEAQDWPDDERVLLFSLHDRRKVVIADGVDQFVRSQTPSSWRPHGTAADFHLTRLTTCLRMKANLSRFVASFTECLDISAERIEPNVEAHGGSVIVLDGDYRYFKDQHDSLVNRNTTDGNRPIDMLICVPPSFVCSAPSEQSVECTLAPVFREWGYEVWDGTSVSTRRHYPTSTEQLRIVQYDSCRGLEGWMSVNVELDTFFAHKFETFLQDAEHPTTEESARLQAARWLLIPLTRAIDTLVINLSAKPSIFRDALEAAAANCSDFVEWRTLR